jgi:methionyl-tRNA formyltransferase
MLVSSIVTRKPLFGWRSWARHLSTQSVPLRIALFGTDTFTVHSLEALHKYMIQHPGEVQALDVITRTPKLSGRGLKTVKEAPSAEYAFENGINVLRAETDSDIIGLSNHDYNLAVAVSYGKLIPLQFLSRLTFGGINVHPSLLPDLSGAAPLHRSLLRRYKTTGVTIQTLHPTKFDKGRVLMHSPEIPIQPQETVASLESKLGEIGAQCLIKVIAERRFADKDFMVPTAFAYKKSYAPKITPLDRNIEFMKDTVSDIMLRWRVLGRLNVFQSVALHEQPKRIILDDLVDAQALMPNGGDLTQSMGLGQYDFVSIPSSVQASREQMMCIIRTKDGLLGVQKMLFEGYSTQTPRQFLKSMRKRGIENTFLEISQARSTAK